MSFRIPFNEFVTIEADTAGEVRDLVREFGVELGGRRRLPAAVEDVIDTTIEPDAPSAPDPQPERRQVRGRRPTPAANDDETSARIVALLKDGPMRPVDIAARLGVERGTLRFHAKKLEAAGIVTVEGSTVYRKWMLAKGAKSAKAEKEAPSRRRGPDEHE